jgi:hypothetical protein
MSAASASVARNASRMGSRNIRGLSIAPVACGRLQRVLLYIRERRRRKIARDERKFRGVEARMELDECRIEARNAFFS